MERSGQGRISFLPLRGRRRGRGFAIPVSVPKNDNDDCESFEIAPKEALRLVSHSLSILTHLSTPIASFESIMVLANLPIEVLTGSLLSFLGVDSVVTLCQTCKDLRAIFGAWLVSESLVHLPDRSINLVPKTLHASLKWDLWHLYICGLDSDESSDFAILSTETKQQRVLSLVIILIRIFTHAYCANISSRVRCVGMFEEHNDDFIAEMRNKVKMRLSMDILQSSAGLFAQKMKSNLLTLSKGFRETVDKVKTVPPENWKLLEKLKSNTGFEPKIFPVSPNVTMASLRAFIPFDIALFLRWFMHDFVRMSEAWKQVLTVNHEFDIGRINSLPSFNPRSARKIRAAL
ncbi:hypothetical protein HK100_008141 [Physocladia obscura]|uniref:F-box domain-containing protein n=1 Tax=Physocladia obscura TaxID=109957 RepID=A0AAD5T721_9FUNG|nr:hypothetical protein HK100_008141 [Physocladia obscura]